MENKFLKITNKEQWQELLDRALFKTFFHNLEWEDFLEKQFKWLKFERYVYKDSALLSLAKVRVFGKEKLVSHPFCEYGGPLPLVEKIDSEEFKQDLFFEFKNPLRISFHPRLLNYFNLPEAVPGKPERQTYFIEDFNQKTKEQIWSFFRKTLRHSIKKAEKQNFKIEKCENKKDLKDFYRIYLKTEKKHKSMPYPFSFFNFFFNSRNSEIILAKFENKIIAGSVFLFYDKIIHYSKNASEKKYQKLNVNSLILWEQIKNYTGRNYEIFDLGGTRTGSSLEVFKRGWGGEKYPIFKISNQIRKNNFRNSKLRNIFSCLPCFLIKKFSPYLLKCKV
jgi:hypothetical protein